MTMTTRPQPLARPGGAIMPGVLRSEWTKLSSLGSTRWSLLITVVVAIAVSAIVTSVYASQYDQGFAARHTIDPTYWSLNGLIFAQLAIGVLGVLTMSGEYGTGLISTTFAAIPQRRTVFVAKAVVASAVALAIGTVSSLGAFFLGQSILSGKHIQAGIGDPGVLRAVTGGGLYLAVLAVLALSLGALIRHSAGAIATFLGLLLVLPAVGAILPPSWQDTITPYFPGNAGLAILHVESMANTAEPWTGFTAFCAYAAVTFAAALFVLPRRDTLPK
jgi:ABC-2 type transport system permease protein